MNIEMARHHLHDRFTAMRADAFVLDPNLALAVDDVVLTNHEVRLSRKAWEEASGTALAPELQSLHRRCHHELIRKLVRAVETAGYSVERIEPDHHGKEQQS